MKIYKESYAISLALVLLPVSLLAPTHIECILVDMISFSWLSQIYGQHRKD